MKIRQETIKTVDDAYNAEKDIEKFGENILGYFNKVLKK
jgi:hypothetical protein